MLTTIIKKEILENLQSYRFPLFFLICAILVPLGLYVNYLDYAKRVSDYNEQVRLTNEILASAQMGDLMTGTVPLKGFRRPSLLSVFAQGFESSLPKFYEFQKAGYKPGETSAGEESILSVQGKPDFVFILQMVISLIVLLFAADVIAGEKELGTLRGVLSNSIPRDTLLIGKLAGGYLALWLPFIIAFLAGMLILSFTAFPFFERDMLIKVLVIFLSASFFMLAYFTIGTTISASASRTRTSLIALLLVWAFFQLIVPKISDMIANIVYPIKTETVVSMQKSLISTSLEEEKARVLGKQYEALFGTYRPNPEPSPELDEWNAFKKEVEQQYEARKAKQVNEIEETYQKEKRIQQTIAANLSLISPSAALARFLTDACGTGETDKLKYLAAVKTHQQSIETELFSKVKKTTLIFPGGATAATMTVEAVDLQALPKFSSTRASLAEIFKKNVGSLISLAFWLIAPFAVAYVRFLKYDVR